MARRFRWRLWLEIGLASASALLAAITFVAPQWIERVFGVDPDEGSGSLEWLIVGGLLMAAVVLSLLARVEWRRTRAGVSI